jgi:hypothetical protein
MGRWQNRTGDISKIEGCGHLHLLDGNKAKGGRKWAWIGS